VDAGVVAGKRIPENYDSLIAKLVVWGPDREAARHRMLRALGEYGIAGVPTTIPFHRWVLETEEFRAGTHFTRFVEQALAETELPRFDGPELDAGVAAAAAADARPAALLVEIDGRRVPVRLFDPAARTAPPPPEHHGRALGGEHGGDTIAAPMQGTILQVLVEQGQEVEAGQVVCILEAMKMENHIASPRDGVIAELPVQAGQVVETGQTIAVIS
jgi:acetyl-CoA/propionyl-CoA carboxylase biotin carboxyl carrier protein